MNKKISFSLIFAFLLFLPINALAWGDTGHMTVAQIAFNNLSPAKRDRANELAALIQLNDREYEFVTSACWMDDTRDFPMFEPLKDWHFITQMFIVDNAVPFEPPPPVNAVSVLRFLGKKLANKNESDLKRAYYLAELVHLTGDIHQPLHCTTRYTPTSKDGDLGGNFFMLGENAPRKNLHSYWDAAGGFFSFRDVRRPLTEDGRKTLMNFAKKITDDFPKNSMLNDVNKTDPEVWAKEGFDLAKSQVYEGIKEDEIPSQTYQNNAQKVAERRIALAGYRLAAILEKAL